MKKRLLVLITVVLLISRISSSMALTPSQKFQQVINKVSTHITLILNRFKDMTSGEWYVSKVTKLVALGGINGYGDSTFKPNNTIST